MPPHQPKWKFNRMRTLFLALALWSITACSFVGFPGVYRINVEQGNILDPEKIEQLEIGMSRRQVRFIMGTPLLEDSFNQDRWDYTHVIRNGQDLILEEQLTLYFDGDTLASMEGDILETLAAQAEAEAMVLEAQKAVIDENSTEEE
jgi:outer membrane protein assembly factor BamE